MSSHGGGRAIRVLNVAEKPSVAKSVAEILSRRGGGFLRSREGRSRYNRVFEFEYTIRGQPCHMLMTSVTGHLMELDFDDRYRRWHSCDPADLYHAPVHKYVPQDKLDIKRTLEEEARSCQWLVLWLDCDTEGENIAFEVLEVCTAINHHLNIWRARFSALIDREIHQSVQNLVRPNKLLADAVDVRQEIDLRIGASFTRFQTMLLKDAFILDFLEDDRNLVLSYGPCQFPTLGFIVERYWEIQSHEPEEFWTINCSHTSDDGTATFNWMRGRLFDYACSVILYEMCVEHPIATVKSVRHQEKLKYPPFPLSTVELQKRASRYFRMSSEHTMKVAEELYQAGFISYPRTETDSFSVNTDLHAIVQEQAAHPDWGAYAQRLLDPDTRLWRNPQSGGHDDKAHPPIHPTKFSPGEPSWSQDHKRLYGFVVRHFLACVSQPAVGAETTVEIDIASEQFSATGRVIISRNYLEVYHFETWGGSIIPTYSTGQQFLPTALTLDSGVTRPPPLLSESDLLSCMDKEGIGTDATMHDHIKKLLDRYYATKDSNTRFSPTNLGEALVLGYDGMGYELWKPYLRSKMECDTKEVSVGTKTKYEVLEAGLQQMEACFLDARRSKRKLFEAMEIFFERSNRSGADTQYNGAEVVCPCGMCQESNMVLKRKPDGNFMIGCMHFPQCRNAVWLPGAISEATVTSNICSTCSPGPVFMIHFKFRRLEIPPNYDVDHLGCIGGCDMILKDLTEICGTGPHNSSSTTARGPQSMGPSNSGQRRNLRQESRASRSQEVQHPRGPRLQNGRPSVTCDKCGETCAFRTANTANNRGRKFYTCPSRDCNFFKWEDELGNDETQGRGGSLGNSSRSSTGRRGGRGGGPRRDGTEDVTFVTATGRPSVTCDKCGETCAFRTANTSNNRGRKFYTCPSRDCNFFKWEDELGNDETQGRGGSRGNRSRSSSTGRRGGRGGRSRRDGAADVTFVTATGDPVSGRCYVCGDPSHFANVCPNRDN